MNKTKENICLTKLLLTVTSIWLNYINIFEIKLSYLKNDYQLFYTSKTKDRKIRGNCNLLIKFKLHKLEWSSPLKNNSRKYLHTCCFGAVVVNMAVLKKKAPKGHFLDIFKKSPYRNSYLVRIQTCPLHLFFKGF